MLLSGSLVLHQHIRQKRRSRGSAAHALHLLGSACWEESSRIPFIVGSSLLEDQQAQFASTDGVAIWVRSGTCARERLLLFGLCKTQRAGHGASSSLLQWHRRQSGVRGGRHKQGKPIGRSGMGSASSRVPFIFKVVLGWGWLSGIAPSTCNSTNISRAASLFVVRQGRNTIAACLASNKWWPFCLNGFGFPMPARQMLARWRHEAPC